MLQFIKLPTEYLGVYGTVRDVPSTLLSTRVTKALAHEPGRFSY